MKIQIAYGTENTDWTLLCELIRIAPFGVRDPEKLKIAVKNSFVVCSVFVGDEKLAGNIKMSAALATITPAVVGVVLNLGVWFGTHVLFPAEGFAWFSAILAIVSFCLMQFYKVGMITIIVGAGGLGLLWHLLAF